MKPSVTRPVARFYARTEVLRAGAARVGRFVADLVYPSKCVHCEEPGELLCRACIAQCTLLGERVCRRCSEPIPTASLCAGCAFRPLAVSTTVAVFAFHGPVRAAVHGLKYDDIRALAPVMARLMASDARVAKLEFDAIVPVPLHPKKLRQRGYNQAELLARELVKTLPGPLDTRSLQRVVATPPLARTTSRVEREATVRDAFRAGPGARGKRILLVDDVTTSGSTTRECALALLAAGATEVNAVVFAKEV